MLNDIKKDAQARMAKSIDALRHTAHSTHLTVQGALEAARRIGARQTWFIHMCHELGHAETEASLPPDVRLAYDGLRIDV